MVLLWIPDLLPCDWLIICSYYQATEYCTWRCSTGYTQVYPLIFQSALGKPTSQSPAICIKVCIPSSARTTTPLIILNKDTSECITLSIPHTSWTWRGLSSPSCAPSSWLLFFFATFASGTATLVCHMSHGWLFWVLAVLCPSLIFCVSFKKTTSSLFQRLMK